MKRGLKVLWQQGIIFIIRRASMKRGLKAILKLGVAAKNCASMKRGLKEAMGPAVCFYNAFASMKRGLKGDPCILALFELFGRLNEKRIERLLQEGFSSSPLVCLNEKRIERKNGKSWYLLRRRPQWKEDWKGISWADWDRLNKAASMKRGLKVDKTKIRAKTRGVASMKRGLKDVYGIWVSICSNLSLNEKRIESLQYTRK